MRRSIPTGLLLCASAVALPASAGAATVSVPAGCHAPSVDSPKQISVPFTVAGLAPNQSANASVTAPGFLTAPATLAFGPADASGNATGTVTVPNDQKITPFPDVASTITITDPASGGVLATAPLTLGNVGLDINHGKVAKSASKKVDWEVSGLNTLTGKSTYYAFFIKAKDAKKKKVKVFDSMKLGTGKGACGYLKAKRPFTPFAQTGAFVVVIQSSKKFKSSDPGIIGAVATKKKS